MAKRHFSRYFDPLWQLRMWKVQLLDENRLFFKSASENCSNPEGQRSVTGIFFFFFIFLFIYF